MAAAQGEFERDVAARRELSAGDRNGVTMVGGNGSRLVACGRGLGRGGVDVLGEEELLPQPLIVMVTPLSIARMAASVNSRRSSIGSRIGSVFICFTSWCTRGEASVVPLGTGEL
jgi:hypothetical protein